VISFIIYDKAISSLLTRKALTQVRWMFFGVSVILGESILVMSIFISITTLLKGNIFYPDIAGTSKRSER
jgi:hypothetical protein